MGIYCFFPWMDMVPLVGCIALGHHDLTPTAVFFFVLGGLGVPLGGILMTRFSYGVDGLSDLFHRIIDPKRIAGRCWVVILLYFPALTLLAGMLARVTSATQQPFDFSGTIQFLAHPASLAASVGFTLIIGPLAEEIGWRGYLLDLLQIQWNALTAGLVVGSLNWIWHLPLFLLPGYPDAFQSVPPNVLPMFFVVVPAVLLYTWVYNNTGRSVLAVILFHFAGNFWGEFFGISAETESYRMVLMVIVVVLIVWWWGPTTLRRNSKSAIKQLISG